MPNVPCTMQCWLAGHSSRRWLRSGTVQLFPCLCNAAAEQVRALVDAGCHQQPSVAATLDDQLAGTAVALLVQVLSARLQPPSQPGSQAHGSRQGWGIRRASITTKPISRAFGVPDFEAQPSGASRGLHKRSQPPARGSTPENRQRHFACWPCCPRCASQSHTPHPPSGWPVHTPRCTQPATPAGWLRSPALGRC
jgi:hypothetical protein